MRDRPRVSVCLATYRRPQLLRAALESIAAQRFDAEHAPELQVLVADNDAGGAGLRVVEALSPGFPWPLHGLIEPTQGISFVRNALVARARNSDYIAFMDDDETAEPGWLCELLRAARENSAQAVLGPVRVSFDQPPPAWLRPLFVDRDLPENAPLPPGHFRTSNILLETRALVGIPGPFDPAFALTGGSDYMLGQRMLARGAKFVWAKGAVVRETLPASRTTLQWYMQRRYRTGMTFAMAQKRVRGPVRGFLAGAYRGAGSIAVGGLKLLRAIPTGRTQLCEAAGLVAYGAGNFAGATGKLFEEYRTIHGR